MYYIYINMYILEFTFKHFFLIPYFHRFYSRNVVELGVKLGYLKESDVVMDRFRGGFNGRKHLDE